jgi:hypothetical protein
VQARFGKGSGYRDDVFSMYADQLALAGLEDELIKAAEDAWQRLVIDPVLAYLAEE